MDLFTPGQSGQAPVQVHDFNPGVLPSGLFWTVPISRDSVIVDLPNGTASMTATVSLADYGDVVKALTGGAGVPASVTFTVNWATGLKIRDKAQGFVGDFSHSVASMSWSATEKNFSFASDAASTSTDVFSLLGTESNGAFYS